MSAQHTGEEEKFPPKMDGIRASALMALADVRPAGPPASPEEGRGLILSSRTEGGRRLPPYYLVYFLLVDLLGFSHLGPWEKSAWTIPVRYRGRLYGIEHRKMGFGIFAPNLAPDARRSVVPSKENEADACEICSLITRAIDVAKPYFEWRAERAAAGTELNITNKSEELFERYVFFRDRYRALTSEAEARKDERNIATQVLEDGTTMRSGAFPAYQLRREAEWNAQAAIEAFFSWTEHAFIHIAILLGRLKTGDDVAKLAEADWKTKFKSSFDLTDPESKLHYDSLLGLRAQIRNFMAHGAFGKNREAFSFHSGAGAVPVLLTHRQHHRYSFTGHAGFDEDSAILQIEHFILHLWSGSRQPARRYLESTLPSILSYVTDKTYVKAMHSTEAMDELVTYLNDQSDRAANMDW